MDASSEENHRPKTQKLTSKPPFPTQARPRTGRGSERRDELLPPVGGGGPGRELAEQLEQLRRLRGLGREDDAGRVGLQDDGRGRPEQGHQRVL